MYDLEKGICDHSLTDWKGWYPLKVAKEKELCKEKYLCREKFADLLKQLWNEYKIKSER